MDEIRNYAEKQIDTAYEALQVAKVLIDHFKADYENLTKESDVDVKNKAYGLFMQAITMSIYYCSV